MINSVITYELNYLAECQNKINNLVQDKCRELIYDKILALVFIYSKIKLVKEPYLIEIILGHVKQLYEKYFKSDIIYIYNNNSNYNDLALLKYSDLVDNNIFLLNNEYLPMPASNKTKLACSECELVANSRHFYKITKLYKPLELPSYKISNLCQKCLDKKNITKYKKYICYEITPCELAIIIGIPS